MAFFFFFWHDPGAGILATERTHMDTPSPWLDPLDRLLHALASQATCFCLDGQNQWREPLGVHLFRFKTVQKKIYISLKHEYLVIRDSTATESHFP
jgi:hypothetical protein